MFGKGFLNGTQSHLHYLPEQHTDFIFSAIAEEWGLIGGCVLILLFFLLLRWGMGVALEAKGRFERLAAAGLTLTIFFYIAVNLMMVMGLAPVVGIPLPLVSYGGSAMLTVMICLGMLMSIERAQPGRAAALIIPPPAFRGDGWRGSSEAGRTPPPCFGWSPFPRKPGRICDPRVAVAARDRHHPRRRAQGDRQAAAFASNSRSAFSQRGRQAAGSRRSETTMSASAQAAERLHRHQPVASAGEQAPAAQVGGAEIGAALGGSERSPARPPRPPARRSGSSGRGHSRRRGRAAERARPSAVRSARWRPSPVTSRSGAGVGSAQSAPAATGTRPQRRQRVRHRQIHSPPATISAKAAARHGRQQGDRAGRGGGGVGEPEQEVERLPGQPPEGRAEADQVEQQGQRLERHDDEGGERDGDDVGERAVEAGLVEMEQRRSASARSRRRGR